jgi:hypothetical protein
VLRLPEIPAQGRPASKVLDWLCADRERKEKEDLDQQIVGNHDAIIFASGKLWGRRKATEPRSRGEGEPS